MVSAVRHYVRRSPALRRCLTPLWERLLILRWDIRRLSRPRFPVTLAIHDSQIRVWPEGEIAMKMFYGRFEAVERDFVAKLVRPGMTVVDAGANIGLYTLICSALMKEVGAIHAFEPGTQTYSRLLRNLELNEARNVHVNRLALSDRPGCAVLRWDSKYPRFDGHRFLVQASREKRHDDELVECATLDSYAEQTALEFADFMKIDVEGAELAVLRGAKRLLERSPNLVLLLECSKSKPEVEGLLRQLGYEFFLWEPERHALRPAKFLESTQLGNIIVARPDRVRSAINLLV